MQKEIKFCLLYRDMWQSSGKYFPSAKQLVKVAPAIIKMGCFDRIESNGGAFEQSQLLKGDNPNPIVRQWTAAFNKAGIQTLMLERALNAITMSPVASDVRKLMFQVKKAQGVDIARSFCGLNDHRNLELSIKYAKEAGMISQVALSITHSPVHTNEYYLQIIDKVIEYGCDEIALKDMAGIGRPTVLGQLVHEIRKKYPNIIIQYHGHSGPGFSVASMLEVAKAGVDYLDVAMEPLSWGMVHPDILTIQEMLKVAGFSVKEIDMKAYMEVRKLTQEFIDEDLGYWINPKNREMSSLLIESGLPGGMMGSMMSDLNQMLVFLNNQLKAQDKKEVTIDEMLVKLFDEVKYVWPKLGYPPLVTPFSQYVKNIAVWNVVNLELGKERWQQIDRNTMDMLLGKAGKLPGELAPEILEIIKEKQLDFYVETPQKNYPDNLNKYEKELKENNWDEGQDREELLEFAMHELQYKNYKSEVAKENYIKELNNFKNKGQINNVEIKQNASTDSEKIEFKDVVRYNNYFIEDLIE